MRVLQVKGESGMDPASCQRVKSRVALGPEKTGGTGLVGAGDITIAIETAIDAADKRGAALATAQPSWRPRRESNPYLALRRRSFYPLNYGGWRAILEGLQPVK
jgi:hypothetical protein